LIHYGSKQFPGFPGAGNGAGTATGMSTAFTFIAVNAMKEEPTTEIAMNRASVCILSSQSKSDAYRYSGTIDNHGSERLIQFDGEGTSFWRTKPLGAAPHRAAELKSHRVSHDWHHLCTQGVHARISNYAIERERWPQKPSVDW
jgi:hypothetical protein